MEPLATERSRSKRGFRGRSEVAVAGRGRLLPRSEGNTRWVLAVTVLLEQLERQKSIEKRLYQISEREVDGAHLRPEAIG
jgi:hypothetical protein